MNNPFKYLVSALGVTLLGASMTSCDDWTDPEPIELKYSTAEGSEDYPAYLEALRTYRKTEHKKVYAWVTLTEKDPVSQSERLTALPDSIDVVVISAPSEMHPTVLADMDKIREEKGMDIIYQIDFDEYKADYSSLCETLLAEADEGATADLPDINDYMLERLTTSLGYVGNNAFDGVIFAFNGKESNHLTAPELADYRSQMLMFLGAASAWHSRNPECIYDYLGNPQYINDTDIIDEFGLLFVRGSLEAANADMYGYYLIMAQSSGIPSDRIAMMTTCPSPDANDVNTGYFTDGTLSLNGFAKWVKGTQVAGVGIQNVQTDYFNPAAPYIHVRNVIQAINPSIR